MEEHQIGALPFAGATPAVTLTVQGRLVAWKAQEGAADPVPVKPEMEDEPYTTLRLVPYAGAKLRITSFPVLSS
jgi:hypothetical protein